MDRKHRPVWIAGVLLATSIVLIAFRLHAFNLPLETDEANYAYIGGRLLASDRLYVDVWDHQPPGVFALFAVVIATFGDAPEVFRWLASAFALGTLFLIYLIVRHVAGVRWGLFAATLFAVLSSDPGTAGEGCNREIYMNTLLLAGWYAALRTREDQTRSRATAWLLASGSAFAAASFLKTIVATHWFAVAGWLAWQEFRSAGNSRRQGRRPAPIVALFAVPPAALWIATLVYFGLTDRLALFTDAVFGFNLAYSQGNGSFWTRFVTFFTPGDKPYLQPFIFDSAFPLWITALLAVPTLLTVMVFSSRVPSDPSRVGDSTATVRERPTRNSGATGPSSAAPALLMLLASYLATCLPAQFWPHYYYLLLPPAIIVTTMALNRLCNFLPGARNQRIAAIVAATALTIALLSSQYRHYLSQPPFGITVIRYNGRDFWGRAQGENVRSVTEPDDEIFVYGADAAIYYYAQRTCASRYTMLTGLRSGYAGHAQRRATMLREIAERRPRLILVVLGEESFPEWSQFLPTHYDAVGWDFRDRPPHDPILMILCDRERPIAEIDWNWDRTSVGGWNLGDAH